ncbi:nickel pincer cofactor biosynthesis protein LarC [Candidatus Eisenbacteria bacterium]|uniref:Putative nickel insertion protein n=1 Tax=Eiseniibacteriota bacterium TaxID=2212470 RepID=A0ABV6YKR1_UNCEI
MRIAYLDCVGGISGDIFVGALLDAGWPEEAFRRTVSWLSDEIADLGVERREHHSLAGLGIRVTPAMDTGPQPPGRGAHAHGEHHHGHGGGKAATRGLKEVLACLEGAPLSPQVRQDAGAVFRRLAEAEAAAHGKTAETVHFHEVGAVDAMVDIVATCQGVRDLGISELYVSPLPLGRGTISGAHGTIPLPAPATSHLLRGVPVHWSQDEGERTTPTGAALVTTLGRWEAPPDMQINAVGVGAGTRTLTNVPNLARLFVGTPCAASSSVRPWSEDGPTWGWGHPARGAEEQSECPGVWRQIVVLSTQVDDATPEEIGFWSDKLRSAGALEVYLVPLTMKKGRPGILMTLIGRPEHEAGLVAVLLKESSTIGVRRRLEWRRELERKAHTVQTRFGPVETKLVLRGDQWIGKPEFESCRAIAEKTGVAFREVWRAAVSSLETDMPSQGAAD